MSRKIALDNILPELIKKGVLSADDAERARSQAAIDKADHSAVYHLAKMGIMAPRQLVVELATFFKVKGVDLAQVRLDEGTLKLVPKEMILEHRILPIAQQERKLLVAMADPTDVDTIEALRFGINLQIQPVVADEYSLEQMIEARFTKTEDVQTYLQELTGGADEDVEVVEDVDVTALAMQEEVDAAPVVKIINHTLSDAVRRGASDIHFEFFEHETRIRFRIDGALVIAARPPKKWDKALIARLKVMSKLNISEKRLPQDGRTKFKVGNRVIDFRVSTLPTNFGEKVVLRILDKSAVSLDLAALGMDAREQETIHQTIQSPFGMVLVTGPTGSGKTTTLYSVMSLLNQPDANIMTAEDPVEYDFPGINQVPVRTEVGLTFPAALRSFLRQDPDVIMVGEMRDKETSEIGIRAALTGHLVLSTMHTNDSASAITRMEEMGIERFNIAAATKLIVAQRLVRKLCSSCKQVVTYDSAQLRRFHMSEEEAARFTFYRGAGCERCNQTGYKGRLGLYELLFVTTEIADMVIAGASATEIKQKAVRDGMQTLRMAGLRKVREGLTSLEEVIKQTTL